MKTELKIFQYTCDCCLLTTQVINASPTLPKGWGKKHTRDQTFDYCEYCKKFYVEGVEQ